jgi:hypothetical protein
MQNDTDTVAEYGPDDDIPKKPKKAGRPRNENFLSWDDAREHMRGEMIPSRGKYLEWWDRNKPKSIPRYPYRVYKEWTTWNDFLGNNNAFNEKVGTKWIPLDEAVHQIHKLKIQTQSAWMEWAKQPGNLPAQIPARPDLVYDNWRSWNHWLGNKVSATIQVQQEAAKTQVYYIIHEQDTPGNVLTFGVEAMGIPALKERWEREKFDVVRMFWYDPAKGDLLRKIVEATTTSYLGANNQRIAPNVWETVYHLSMHLDQVKL